MKKYFFLSFLLGISLFAEATHLISSSITWDTTANGQYLFYLTIYRDCGTATAQAPVSATLSGNSGVTISLSRVFQGDISQSCYDSTLTYKCGSSQSGYGAIEKNLYRSAPITFAGTPPTTGWIFNWSSCCRPSNTTNVTSSGFSAISYIYPTGMGKPSPAFNESEMSWVVSSMDTNYFYFGAIPNGAGDSIHYELADASSTVNQISYIPQAPTYATGYSKTSPLPSTTQNVNNVGLSVDATTGIGHFYSETSGSFVVNVKIESFENGSLASVIYRELVIYISSNVSGNAGSNKPVVSVSNNNAATTLTKASSGHYTVDAGINDTIDLEWLATDLDTNNFGSAQWIDFLILYGDTSCAGDICATTTPGALQSGYSSDSTNTVHFKAYLNNPVETSAQYMIAFKDDYCPSPNYTFRLLTINYRPSIHTPITTYDVCEGDVVQIEIYGDTSNLLWTPNYFISDPTSSKPTLAPDSTTTYTVKDLVSGDSIVIDVNVLNYNKKMNLVDHGTHITCTNSMDFDSIVWFYNHVMFSVSDSSVINFGTGTYYGEAYIGKCKVFSDTIAMGGGNLVALGDTSGSISNDSTLVNGTYTMQLTLGSIDNNKVDSIVLISPKSTAGKTNYYYNLTVKDNGSITHIDYGIVNENYVSFSNPFILMGQKAMTFEIETDNASLPIFEPATLPYTDANGLVVSSNPSFTPMGGSNKNISGFPYMILYMSSGIGIQEAHLILPKVYPNPFNNKLYVSWNKAGKMRIIDVVGNLVLEAEVSPNTNLDLSHFKEGIYFYEITSDGQTYSGKLIKE